MLQKQDSHIKLKGILWHQGESDRVTEELVLTYEGKLHQLISELQSPKLPFVVGKLADFFGTGVDHCAPAPIKRINTKK